MNLMSQKTQEARGAEAAAQAIAQQGNLHPLQARRAVGSQQRLQALADRSTQVTQLHKMQQQANAKTLQTKNHADTMQSPVVQRLVVRIRNLKEMMGIGNPTIMDSSLALKNYSKFGGTAKWKEDTGIKKARHLDADEPLVVVSHGGEPYINWLGNLKVSFGGEQPAALAEKIGGLLPADYSGEIFLNGCYTGMRIGYTDAGTSFIEAFGAHLLQYIPNYPGIIKGNIGAASTLSADEELISITQTQYDHIKINHAHAVATNDDGTKFYLRGPFGQARYRPSDGSYNDMGYRAMLA
jgi:hypothetical protein